MYLNPKIGETWFKRWAREMNVTIVTDARQGAEWIALGRFAIGMFGMSTQAEALKYQGFPISDYLPHPMEEGQVLSASAANIMVMDKAPNPHAAQLFVNWALSREGQATFIKAAEKTDSLRTDVPNDVIEPQYRIDPKANYYVAFTDREYIERKSEITGRLKTIMQEAGYR
jgi:ABC-type Fe3+ transport system substrate-binding protein